MENDVALLFLGDGGLFDDAILLELVVGELERTRFLSAFHLVLLLLGLAVGCLHTTLARNVLEVLLVGLVLVLEELLVVGDVLQNAVQTLEQHSRLLALFLVVEQLLGGIPPQL